MTCVLEVKQLSFSYKGSLCLKQVDFELQAGELVLIAGKSGAGKSTLLRILCGEQFPQAGILRCLGREVDFDSYTQRVNYRRQIAYSPQPPRLIADRTVFRNISYFLEHKGEPQAKVVQEVAQLLEELEISDISEQFPAEISGGQQARLGIANALVKDAEIIVLDEPTANLEPRLSKKILALLVGQQRVGKTVIVATHDEALLSSGAGRLLKLVGGDLLEVGHA